MSADRRRRRLRAHRRAAQASGPAQGGELPTPERLRRGEIQAEPIVTTSLVQAERDWTGDRPARVQRTLTGEARRDLAASVRHRLGRFRDLEEAQIVAAERLEKDWSLARLEPPMVCDAGRPRGPRSWTAQADAAAAVMDARDRIQAARSALRRGGPEVLRVVEGVVMLEAAAGGLGAQAYAARRDGSVYVRTLLGVGLNLLADHYGACRRRPGPGLSDAGRPPGRSPGPPGDRA